MELPGYKKYTRITINHFNRFSLMYLYTHVFIYTSAIHVHLYFITTQQHFYTCLNDAFQKSYSKMEQSRVFLLGANTTLQAKLAFVDFKYSRKQTYKYAGNFKDRGSKQIWIHSLSLFCSSIILMMQPIQHPGLSVFTAQTFSINNQSFLVQIRNST